MIDTILARLPWALGVNLALSLVAWRVGTVRPSGALAGILLGTVIWLGLGPGGFAVLFAFFVLGSALTRFGYARKAALGAAEDRGGARGASHAVANAGVPALAAGLALATGNDAWPLFFTAAFATAAMDTAGSEIGPLYGRRTVSLKNLRPVAPGTEGAVSLEGTAAGLGVAAVLGTVGWGSGLIAAPAVVAVVFGALVGNLYEGILGSRRLLPHAWLNLTNTLVGGLTAVLLRLVG
jgi:uncharacterized protein (TIGR00297 family)